jgi:hypothetical protein
LPADGTQNTSTAASRHVSCHPIGHSAVIQLFKKVINQNNLFPSLVGHKIIVAVLDF